MPASAVAFTASSSSSMNKSKSQSSARSDSVRIVMSTKVRYASFISELKDTTEACPVEEQQGQECSYQILTSELDNICSCCVQLQTAQQIPASLLALLTPLGAGASKKGV
eukprot:1140250-Pelagomonas_calceolata.AAC.3